MSLGRLNILAIKLVVLLSVAVVNLIIFLVRYLLNEIELKEYDG